MVDFVPDGKELCLVLLLSAWCLSRADDIPAAQASSHAGETATVCRQCHRTPPCGWQQGKPTFINFNKRYPNQDFKLMIWEDDRPGFGDLEKYAGHQV